MKIFFLLIALAFTSCAGYTTRVGGAYEGEDGHRYEAYTEIYRPDSKSIKPLK